MGLFLKPARFAVSSLITDIAAPVSGIDSTSVLLRHSVRRGWSWQDRLRQLNVNVFDLLVVLVLVGFVKHSLLNLIVLYCPGAIDDGGLLSKIEYDCGDKSSP